MPVPERDKSLWGYLLVGLILFSPVLGMVLYRHQAQLKSPPRATPQPPPSGRTAP